MAALEIILPVSADACAEFAAEGWQVGVQYMGSDILAKCVLWKLMLRLFLSEYIVLCKNN